MSNQEPSPPLGFGTHVQSDPCALRIANSKELYERIAWHGIHAIAGHSRTDVRSRGHASLN